MTSANPARIFGLKGKGALASGYDADVVIYDPRVETTLRAAALHNLAGYTPYEGWKIQGAVRDVLCGMCSPAGGRLYARASSFPRQGGGGS